MKLKFEENTWEEIKEGKDQNALILFPIGQTEEHGKHLPLNTDALIAEKISFAVAEKIYKKIPVFVMPAVWTGYSTKEVRKWPGTISVSLNTFKNLVEETCGNLIDMGFKKIVLVSCHGNHKGILEVVARELADKHSIYIALTEPTVLAKEKIAKILETKDVHGGEYETSLMLYFDGKLVKKEKFTSLDKLNIKYNFYPGKAFVSTWGLQKSKTGIYGDPTKSDSVKGGKILEVVVEEYKKFLEEFYYI